MSAPESSGGRERILQEARRLFVERGYRGLSMREIADAVGFSKAALYYHFRDKEELFAAVVHAVVQELGEMVATALASAPTRRAALTEIVQAILAQPPEHQALTRLVSQELCELSEQQRSALVEEYYRLFLGRLHQAIAQGTAAGEFRAVDPVVATWALLGMLQPYFAPEEMGRASRRPSPAVVAELLHIFFEGVAAPVEPKNRLNA